VPIFDFEIQVWNTEYGYEMQRYKMRSCAQNTDAVRNADAVCGSAPTIWMPITQYRSSQKYGKHTPNTVEPIQYVM
jgi:hypothetical protein